MRIKPLLVFLLFAVDVLACGKSKEEKFADTYCSEIAKCCAQADITGGDGTLCRWAMSSGVSNIDACLTELNAEVADGTFCTYLGNPPNATAASSACAEAVRHGSKKPGESCVTDSDCAASDLGPVSCASAYVNGDFIDKCQVQIPGRAGDSPCLGTRDGDMTSSTDPAGDVAPQGYICDTADGVVCKGGACTALTAVGGSCGSSYECVRTAFCDSSQGKCAAKVSIGDACVGKADDECEGGYCDSQGGTKQCAAKVANGAACSDGSMCISDNCVDGSCKPGIFDSFGLGLLCG
jgi:hypothetical protein